MSNTQARDYPAVHLGPLPVEAINRALGLELDAGEVWMTGTAQAHVANEHPEDYSTCLCHLSRTVGEPLYIGQGPHRTNIELVTRTRSSPDITILVAVGMQPKCGRYFVRSMYRINEDKITNHRLKRYLKLTEMNRLDYSQ